LPGAFDELLEVGDVLRSSSNDPAWSEPERGEHGASGSP
jgi:hypothetical protein